MNRIFRSHSAAVFPTPAKKVIKRSMEVQGVDIISNLSHDITGKILSLLPVRDLMRTSILSRKWRYLWASTPAIVVDDEKLLFKRYFSKYKLLNVIFHVLLLHKGPLVKFTLSAEVDTPFVAPQVNQIILYLSTKSNTLKSFNLLNRSSRHYKMPSSILSLIKGGLEHLELSNCDFEPAAPFTFHDQSFSTLSCLCFSDVKINAKMLMCFLANCPLLKHLYLLGYNDYLIRKHKLKLVEFLECLPSVEVLEISWQYMKYLFLYGIPHELPVSVVHLKVLFMGMCLMNQGELSSALCLIESTPNLKKLCINLGGVESRLHFFDLRYYSSSSSGLKLDCLEELEVRRFSNLPIEVEFLKLLISKSSMLKRVMVVVINDIDKQDRIYRDLIHQLPFSCVSTLAKIIIKRPK